MRVILSSNVPHLGTIGQVVKVKDGYGRNFLIPRGMAVLASEKNEAALNHQLRLMEKKKSEVLKEARALAAKIEKISVTVSKHVGEEEKIFGSVTNHELEILLAQQGLKISKREIHLTEEIKKLGVYHAEIKIHPEVQAKFKIWVVAAS